MTGANVTERMSATDYRSSLSTQGASSTSKRAALARRQPEYDEQVNLFILLDLLAIEHPDRVDDLCDIWASANGGMRSRGAAGRLRASGVRKGVPDVEVMVAMKGFHAMLIELKAVDSGSVSKEQKVRIERLNRRGYLAIVAQGWVAAGRALCEYLDLAWRDRWIVAVELERTTRRRGDWCRGALHGGASHV